MVDRTLKFAPLPEVPMSSEPLTTTTIPADVAASSEMGLLIAVLVMVLLGSAAMILMQ